MKKKIFQGLKVINNDEKDEKLNINDLFLEGLSMIDQKETKNAGDHISYFKVIKIKEVNSYEFTIIQDRLED